jgi:beta-glucosidase-like glycosyl hydrolase
MGAINGTISEKVRNTLDAGVDLALFSNGSDEERRTAVEASGELRLNREEPNTRQVLPEAVIRKLLSKLDRVSARHNVADPTWDRQI